MTLASVYFYGPLAVSLCNASGAVLSVQCRLDGAAAEGRYRSAYISAAIAWAIRQHSATYAEG